MLMVGTPPQTIKALQIAILAVLNSRGGDQSTKVEAIKALANCAGVNGTTVQNCNFQTGVK